MNYEEYVQKAQELIDQKPDGVPAIIIVPHHKKSATCVEGNLAVLEQVFTHLIESSEDFKEMLKEVVND